jgi:hypothetical protein
VVVGGAAVDETGGSGAGVAVSTVSSFDVHAVERTRRAATSVLYRPVRIRVPPARTYTLDLPDTGTFTPPLT